MPKVSTFTEIAQAVERMEALLQSQAGGIPADMTVTQAAKVLGVSRETASRYCRHGRIKKNRRGRIPATEVRRFLEA